MRLISLFIVILLFHGFNTLKAQEFEVREFRYVPEDTAARMSDCLTSSGEKCAIIKVNTTIRNMQFDSNIGFIRTMGDGGIEYKENEIWLYIAPGERAITLMAEGFLNKRVPLPEQARSNRVYEIVVTAPGMHIPVTDKVNVDMRLNESGVYISFDNTAPIIAHSNIQRFQLEKGTEYTFHFRKEGFQDKSKTVKFDNHGSIDINLTPGRPVSRLPANGHIVIETSPKDAELYLNERFIGNTPHQERLPAGLYQMEIRHHYYHSYFDGFELREDDVYNPGVITLSPRHGFLVLDTDPSGAEVIINGNFAGITPFGPERKRSGIHDLQIRRSLYHDINDTFTIHDGDTVRLEYKLPEAFGRLVINSEPQGATVLINDRSVGTTPYENLQKAPGRYNIRLDSELYIGHSETVVIREGKTDEIFMPLVKNYGTLKVHAEGADIFINENRVGTNKYEGNVRRGFYSVIARKSGHSDAQRDIMINVGEEYEFTLEPRLRSGRLNIKSEPFGSIGAEIYINGERQNRVTPASITLPEGTYNIDARKEGFMTERAVSVHIRENEEQDVVIDMFTADDIPEFQGFTISNISGRTATAGAHVIASGRVPIIERGICWSNRPNPDIRGTCRAMGSGQGYARANMSSLEPNTQYFVRAYATTNIQTYYSIEQSFRTTVDFSIGDRYGGGIVAYINQPGDPGYIEGRITGLIAASYDQGRAEWGCMGVNIRRSSTGIGSGADNTEQILSRCTQNNNSAARLSRNFNHLGFTDWFLPSKDELNKLYVNKDKIGGFSTHGYWSSSTDDNNTAWAQSFGNGNQTTVERSRPLAVRAVRRFVK